MTTLRGGGATVTVKAVRTFTSDMPDVEVYDSLGHRGRRKKLTLLLVIAFVVTGAVLIVVLTRPSAAGTGSAADGTDLSFSGNVEAHWVGGASSVVACPQVDNSVDGRTWAVRGLIDGRLYELQLSVFGDYSGPPTYPVANHPANEGDAIQGYLSQPDRDEAQTFVLVAGSATLNRDERSGTIDATLADISAGSGPVVAVKGRWACVPAQPPAPTPSPSPWDKAAARAAGATAICKSGTWSYSPDRSRTCLGGRNGVYWWTGNVAPAGPGPIVFVSPQPSP